MLIVKLLIKGEPEFRASSLIRTSPTRVTFCITSDEVEHCKSLGLEIDTSTDRIFATISEHVDIHVYAE